MFDLLRDCKFTLRRLARTPVFTLATLVTLALGIGANTAIFTVINGVLLKPLPFANPDQLIGVWQTAPGVNIKDLNASLADYITYREESHTFAEVAIWNGRSITVTEFADPERVQGMQATFRLLATLGVHPVLGRDFVEKDNETGSPDTVLISHAYWQRRFGGDPKVIGRRILADGAAREIIGVLPQGFWFMDQRHDLILPLRFDRAKMRLAGYNFQGIARLRAGVTLQQASADVARMLPIEFRKFPPPPGFNMKMLEDARLAPNLRPLKEDLLGDIGNSLWVVMATIGMVLLIACANVANLLLVRAEGRAQEFAVRAALGAGRAHLARELFVESILIALLGGALGVGLAIGVVQLVLSMSPVQLPRMETITVDATSLLFTLGISLVAGLAFGAIPVIKHSGVRFAQALRAGGRNASAGRDRNFARNMLTVVQVSLAVVLLIGSGLMLRTFQSMRGVHPGFHTPDQVQTLRISIPKSAAPDEVAMRHLEQTIADRLASLPGVTAVGLSTDLPLTNFSSQDPIYASDKVYPPNQIPTLRRFHTAAPGAFTALGVPLLAGRESTWTDVHEKRNVALVAESFARELWGSPQAAIGKQIRQNPTDPWNEVIGVVGDIRHDGVDKKATSSIYWPLRFSNQLSVLVRGPRAGSESLTTEIRQAIWAVNPSIPITDMRTMQEVYTKSMARTAFTMSLLGISGLMALLLAAIGIYAVISYTVAQRTREIGIRMALGAQHGALQRMFVGHGLIWGGAGAAVGLLAAAALSRLMSSLLFGINPADPLTYAAVAAGLLAATAFASYLPARRVTRVDPADALRAE